MESLANYGSDGESNGSENTSTMHQESTSFKGTRQSDVNYDLVQMDMSEESNNNHSSEDSNGSIRTPERHNVGSHRSSPKNAYHSNQRHKDYEERSSSSHDGSSKHSDKYSDRLDDKQDGSKQSNSSRKYKDTKRENEKVDKDARRYKEDDKRSRDREKSRDNDRRRSTDRYDKDYHNDDRRDRDRERDRRDDRGRRRDRDRSPGKSRDKSSDRDRDRSRGKSQDKSREKYRGREREHDRDRRYSKDDKSRNRYREERRSRDRHSRTKSRSRSRGPTHRIARDDKGRNKLAQLEKLGIDIKTLESDAHSHNPLPNYYNPLTTATQGKYAEQIQKRKLLWANNKKQDVKVSAPVATTGVQASAYAGTTFSHDQDGKAAAKFKRLMGIKDDTPAAAIPLKPDILKKQEEMFSHMEQQYEVARATTHTQRGVGFGYATGSFSFPR